MHPETFLVPAVILLAVTATAVALFKRLGLGSVLGLLVAGMVVGPHSPGLHVTEQVAEVRHFTELGVVLLLFVIGLEMRPRRLWALRREVFGLGSLQILLTGLVIGLYSRLFLEHWGVAMLIGMTFALSSTAFVMQLLQERGETASPHGSTAFAILLMQDLAIVPLLALVPILSTTGTLSAAVPLWQQVAVVVGMLGAVWGLGGWLLPRALHRLMQHGNREGFLLLVLLAVFFAAWAMHMAGLSMALGAFIMGMLLSGSQYSYQIQALVEPYKGLLMSLFFVAVGMSIDFQALGQAPWLFALHVLVIVLLKLLVLFLLLLAFGKGRVQAVRIGFLLGQSGEFGFVLFGAALTLGVISETVFVTALGVISVSMLLTPLLVRLGDALAARLARQPAGQDATGQAMAFSVGESAARVVIAGYGRVGHTVATLLQASGVPYLALDTQPQRVEQAQAQGHPVYFGDVRDPRLLDAIQLREGDLVVITIDQPAAALRAVRQIRQSYPRVPVIARARDLAACDELLRAGASEAYPEAVEASLRLAGMALQGAGVAGEGVDELLQEVRARGYAQVRAGGEA